MKHLKWVIGAAVFVIAPMVLWAGVANAQRFSTFVDKGETVNSSLYSAGKNVDISGTVNGDVFCAGQTVTIDAVVHGDIICAGQDVTIAGKVDGDIRVAGQVVAIEAEVSRNATVAAMSFSLDASAKVGRDLTLTGDNLNVKGSVGRDVVASGNSLTLNGPVGRHVKAENTTVKLKDNAAIAGNFTYTSVNKADIANGARIEGETKRDTSDAGGGSGWSFNVGFYLFALSGLLLIGLSLAFFFPHFMHYASGRIKRSFGKSLLTGLLAGIAGPILVLVMIISIVGIPFAFFLATALLMGFVLSGPIAGYYVGRLVLSKQKNPLFIMLAGGTIVTTAYFLPWVGLIAILLAYWLGFGALLLTLKEQLKPGYQPTK